MLLNKTPSQGWSNDPLPVINLYAFSGEKGHADRIFTIQKAHLSIRNSLLVPQPTALAPRRDAVSIMIVTTAATNIIWERRNSSFQITGIGLVEYPGEGALKGIDKSTVSIDYSSSGLLVDQALI